MFRNNRIKTIVQWRRRKIQIHYWVKYPLDLDQENYRANRHVQNQKSHEANKAVVSREPHTKAQRQAGRPDLRGPEDEIQLHRSIRRSVVDVF